MTTVRQRIAAPVEQVFDALCDPRTYPEWLVGAQEIRDIDDDWPRAGSLFHHRVGLAGPLTVADSTKAVAAEPPRLLELEVRARPFGRAIARFTVRPDGDGSEVELTETPIGRLGAIRRLLDPMLAGRNTASLQKLARLIESGELERPAPTDSTGET